MTLGPDNWIIIQIGPLALSATLVFSWLVILLLVAGSALATLNIKNNPVPEKWQNAMEHVIQSVSDQIDAIAPGTGHRYLPFIATLFLFILVSNLIGIVPGVTAPTASLSTATALAIAVLIAVPAFGITRHGVVGFLTNYIRPSIFMLPFNLIGELSRTFALAIRLYGNIMSGAVLAAILVTIAPLFFPVLMQGFSLLTGVIQAYIFAVLAAVYIASANPSPKPEAKESAHV